MSYADLVTVLLACFAASYAAGAAPPAPLSSNRSPEPSAESAAPAAVVAEPAMPPAAAPPAEPDDPVSSLRARVEPALAEDIDRARIELIEDAHGLVLSLPESATFAIGRADLTPAAETFLARLAEELSTVDVRIRIEGHTDDTPVRGGRYRSNWELSTARASAVVAFLISSAGVEAARLSAAGYGEFHPRVANDSEDQRARNRRVDVVIMPAGRADTGEEPRP